MMRTDIHPLDRRQSDRLSSELVRACLPQATRDDDPKFAWVTAVSLLFLGVGLYGLFARPVFTVPKGVAVEDNIPVLFEPPPPQPTDSPPPPEASQPDASESEVPPPPPVVVAVAEPEEATFAVPVAGPVILAPAHLASAPPLDLSRSTNSAPSITLFTGSTEGRFPAPSYPRQARERRLQGKLLLLVAVGRNGLVERVEVKETTGSDLLDLHAADWIKNYWVWPPGETRLFHVPVVFELK
jgi:TonB family protein